MNASSIEYYKIIVEYDGSGHDLAVKRNKITQEAFDEKEYKKYLTFKQNGWKYLIVKNPTEKYLNNKRLKQISDIISDIKNNKYDSVIIEI